LLPPRERRGVVLVDPPYEAEDEFRQAARAVISAHRRFATGIYLWWYPIKSHIAVDAAADELRNAGIKNILRADIDIGIAPSDKHPDERLSATGVLLVNPPYGLYESLQAALPVLVELLRRGPGAKFDLVTLAKDD